MILFKLISASYLQEFPDVGAEHTQDRIVAGFLTELEEHLAEHLQNVTCIHFCLK